MNARVALFLISSVFLVHSQASQASLDRDSINASFRVAAREGRLKELARLLAQGADVNSTSEYGHTALIYAAISGQAKTIDYLLSQGADANLRDGNDNSPLLFASWNCNNRAVRNLLQYDADVNLQNHNGQTALMNASEQGCRKVVSLLLKVRGIDVHVRNDWDKTALDYVAADLFSDLDTNYGIARMLRDAGARENGVSVIAASALPLKPRLKKQASKPEPVLASSGNGLLPSRAVARHP